MPWLDWLSLFVRWFHVVAGVAWIGASFYFIWLDNSLRSPPEWKQKKGIKGDLWAIHGGGFYEVGKYAYGPEKMPETLHWFKWEAYSTWLSGFFLLIIVYYFGASAYLIDPRVNAMDEGQAVTLGLVLIFGGLALYEGACRSPLARYPKAFAVVLIAMIALASWLAAHWFSGRGAYIHVGALIGTIMVGNVFLNIMPNQRKMVAAVAEKREIDPTWGAGAKLRSVHNNYFTLPVLFIMISNHYPMTYQHEWNWLVLLLIMAISAWIRHFFNLRHLGIVKPGILISGAVAMLALTLWVSWPQKAVQETSTSSVVVDSDGQTTLSSGRKKNPSAPTDEQAFALITQHCQSCHSASPTDNIFKVAPLGVRLDTWEDVERYAPQIIRRATVTKDMPFMNKTGMTQEERQQLANWYASFSDKSQFPNQYKKKTASNAKAY
ncbi:urate hydroxylase PuuD [Alteromonas pelagimontana]|uniref:Urate hydroxylase PuuD n=1 Tax=Alteromonas pelagimontana TaxID=1858656 RepID=A0A6M4M8K2_9ALTE|nr:urate hydroxylase PuuD [Alteromonas pelagimontana]QJR79551.1 urate hydroxylase PuuD [Alteromonas pelagimontana]